MRTGDRGDVLRDGIEVRALIDDRRLCLEIEPCGAV
jgi:hypothetical protein